MNIVIERPIPSDASDLLEYLRQIGSETDNLTFGKEGLSFTPEAEAEYIRQLENSCDEAMFVAKDNGKIVGSASLNRFPRRMMHRGDLSISVLKEYWNKGIGSKLMCAIFEFAKKQSFEIIDLQVRSDNLHAIHLYEKYGFKKIGAHPYFLKIDGDPVSFDYMFLRIE